MRFLTELAKRNLAGTVCLLRVDLNVERRADAFRLEAALPSIRFLLARRARVLLLSHRGRPTGAERAKSLRGFAPFLRRTMRRPVTFFPAFDWERIAARLRHDRHPALFLLENLRFLPGEAADDRTLARNLASLGDLYINDAFSVSHRANASITGLPQLLPSYAGLRLEEEIATLSRVMRRARQPLLLVLGGAKVSDKTSLLSYLLPKTREILIGGATANTFLKARGDDIGTSFFEPAMLPVARRLLRSPKIVLPTDFLQSGGKLLDIGPLSVERFLASIRRAGTIIWNGPMGLFEKPRFRNGSEAIARGIARSRAYSVVGGGETTELVTALGLTRRFGFVSTGGGAMLSFLGGEKLPGIEALHRS